MPVKRYRWELSQSALASWNETKTKRRLLQRGMIKLKRLIVFERRTSFERLDVCFLSQISRTIDLLKMKNKSESAASTRQETFCNSFTKFFAVWIRATLLSQ